MKNNERQHPLRSALGITQDEMAMLLGVTRGQWSMFELGRRPLPLPSSLLLTEMLLHLQSPQFIVKPVPRKQQALQQWLERALRENEYQRVKLARTLAVIEKKQAAQERLCGLIDYLDDRESKTGKGLAFPHRDAVSKTAAADYDSVLLELLMKKEMLEFEKTLLESRIKDMTAGNDVK